MVKDLTSLLTSFFSTESFKTPNVEPILHENCILCECSLQDNLFYTKYRVCPQCRFHYGLKARERINLIADPNSFRESNHRVTSIGSMTLDYSQPYNAALKQDQERTGLTEAAITGQCTIQGFQSILVVLDFSFMGGTMSSVAGERIALAFEQGAKKKIPVIAIVTSGGSRIQEGMLSLLQMAKTSASARLLHKKGIPFISVLANPCTGQTFASFANLADIIIAEPKAIIGLAPTRIMQEATPGKADISKIHSAEDHLANGMIDAIVDREFIRESLGSLIELTMPEFVLTEAKTKTKTSQYISQATSEAWDTVQLARHQERPTTVDYIERIISNFIELHGDRALSDDKNMICGFGFLAGQSVCIIGQLGYRENRSSGLVQPEGLRKAQRVMKLAEKFRIPIITFIDTSGADPSLQSERHGIGSAIATTLSLMSELETRIISVIIGEGGGEGALSMTISDNILMMENAIYTPMSPEKAASIFYNNQGLAAEVAKTLKLTSADAHHLGIVDTIVREPKGGAHLNHTEAAHRLDRELIKALSTLQKQSMRRLLRLRYKKFRNIGEYSSHFRLAVKKELTNFKEYIKFVRSQPS